MRRALVFALLCTPAAFGQQARTLTELLDKIGRQVETLTEQLSAVTCKESVDQLKLTPQGKPLAEQRETYDYVMLLQKVAGRLTVDESRQRVGGQGKQPTQALLITGGFSVLALIFHPEYQSGYLFREVPGASEGKTKISFEAVPGAHSPSVISLKPRLPHPVERHGAHRHQDRCAARNRSLARELDAGNRPRIARRRCQLLACRLSRSGCQLLAALNSHSRGANETAALA
jgi:hypothetical protein